MKRLLLSVILFASTCFGQFGLNGSLGFGGFDSGLKIQTPTVSVSSPFNLTDSLVALWQNGSLIDSTGRGNNLTASHVDPAAATAWSALTNYTLNQLATSGGVTYRARNTNINIPPAADVAFIHWTPFIWEELGGFNYVKGELSKSSINAIVYRCIADVESDAGDPSIDAVSWTINAPQVVSSGLSGIPNATQFNGVDNYASRASTADLQLGGTDFTIACWVKGRAGFADGIFHKYGIFEEVPFTEYELTWGDDGSQATPFGVADGYVTPKDVYTHLVYTVGGGIGKAYANGVEFSVTVQTLPTTNVGDFYLGRVVEEIFGGIEIAQLAIWKRALSAGEVSTVFANGNGIRLNP